MKARRLKTIPPPRSDAMAKHFVETPDLTEYDLSGFKPTRLEIEPKSAAINMRLLRRLLDSAFSRAAKVPAISPAAKTSRPW
jgi:predicted DNA binding CopG/RHH family protein